MSVLLDVARLAAGLNVVLLVILAWIWGRNYRQIRSKQTLGTLVFALALQAENVVALYYYLSPPPMSVAAVRAMMVLQVLESVALLFLTYVTME